jgi:hypothetical protein
MVGLKKSVNKNKNSWNNNTKAAEGHESTAFAPDTIVEELCFEGTPLLCIKRADESVFGGVVSVFKVNDYSNG